MSDKDRYERDLQDQEEFTDMRRRALAAEALVVELRARERTLIYAVHAAGDVLEKDSAYTASQRIDEALAQLATVRLWSYSPAPLATHAEQEEPPEGWNVNECTVGDVRGWWRWYSYASRAPGGTAEFTRRGKDPFGQDRKPSRAEAVAACWTASGEASK